LEFLEHYLLFMLLYWILWKYIICIIKI